MCTHTRTIKNRTRRYVEGVTKARLQVSCGKCDDCRARLQRDWSIRTFAEIERYNKAGGKVIFATFTYSNRYLPIRHLVRDGKIYDIPCFDKNDKNAYFNHMRVEALRRFGHTGKDGLPIRYIWASEYGEDDEYLDIHNILRRGTKRPHYHALIFLPADICKHFKTVTEYKNWIAKFWRPRGFVRWSKSPSPNNLSAPGIFVTKEYAAEYVSKYCTKDLNFWNQPDLIEYLDLKEDGSMDKDAYETIKDNLPRHWQSLHFGESLVEVYKTVEDFDRGVNFNWDSHIETGLPKYIPAPQYIIKKVLYDIEPDGSYILNDKGVEIRSQLFIKKVEKFADELKKFTSSEYIDSLISHDEIKKYFADFDFRNSKDIVNYITLILDKRDFLEVSLFDKVWRGKFIPRNDEAWQDVFDSITDMPLDKFIDLSKEEYYVQLISPRYPTVYQETGFFHFTRNETLDKLLYFDLNKRFQGFHDILDICQKVRDIYCKNLHCRYLEDRKRRKRENRELYNKTA